MRAALLRADLIKSRILGSSRFGHAARAIDARGRVPKLTHEQFRAYEDAYVRLSALLEALRRAVQLVGLDDEAVRAQQRALTKCAPSLHPGADSYRLGLKAAIKRRVAAVVARDIPDTLAVEDPRTRIWVADLFRAVGLSHDLLPWTERSRRTD